MSDIYGTGFGSNHEWVRGKTEPVNSIFGSSSATKSTFYSCKNCHIGFRHNYDDIPDIFLAMERAGVPEKCNQEKE